MRKTAQYAFVSVAWADNAKNFKFKIFENYSILWGKVLLEIDTGKHSALW